MSNTCTTCNASIPTDPMACTDLVTKQQAQQSWMPCLAELSPEIKQGKFKKNQRMQPCMALKKVKASAGHSAAFEDYQHLRVQTESINSVELRWATSLPQPCTFHIPSYDLKTIELARMQTGGKTLHGKRVMHPQVPSRAQALHHFVCLVQLSEDLLRHAAVGRLLLCSRDSLLQGLDLHSRQ